MNLAIIKQLVAVFHTDHTGGSTHLPTQVPGPALYNAMLDLLDATLGEGARRVFAEYVDATDDFFYLRFSPMEERSREEIEKDFATFWTLLMTKSNVQDDNELLLKIGGFSRDKDNNGQIVLYTDLMEKDGVIVPFVEADDES